MRKLLQDITYLWQYKWSFKLALTYLGVLLLAILALPFLPFSFGPNELHLSKVYLKPFSDATHLFGTDQLGRDVLVNSLYGARNGLFLAIPVMLIASFFGTGIGVIAGYFGNNTFQVRLKSLLWFILTLAVVSYYVVYLPIQLNELDQPVKHIYTSWAVGIAISAILWFILRMAAYWWPLLQKPILIPLDGSILRVIELITSLPKLLVLIAVAAFAPPSVVLLSAIFVFTYWTGTARLARAEMLRIRQLPYLEAAISTGMPTHRILFKEAVPNLLTPVIVAFVFGIGGLLTIESTLSFLGIGLPADFPSWGRTISGIRSNLSAWWLVTFPGGFLAITVLALQICSYHIVRLNQFKA